MTRQWYIGMIAAFALGLALGAEIVAWPTRHAIEVGKQASGIAVQLQSDRDQAYGRLDECEGLLKSAGIEEGPDGAAVFTRGIVIGSPAGGSK